MKRALSRKPQLEVDRDNATQDLLIDYRTQTYEMLMKLTQHNKTINLQREALERGDLAAALALNDVLHRETQDLLHLEQRDEHNHNAHASMAGLRVVDGGRKAGA